MAEQEPQAQATPSDSPTTKPSAENPTIVLSGGGTGGHISPILAVARELKKLRPSIRIIYIGERNGKFSHMLDDNSDIDQFYTIFSGKFRRYHGESWLRRLTDLKTLYLNIRDSFFVLLGIFQSYRLLGKLQPDMILLKGGFVGVPVGLAAAARKLPFITHDSDALPGLANRTVSRWARLHATAMSPDYYNYRKTFVRQVGVLVSADYKPVTPDQKKQFKIELQLPPSAKVMLVTGGSLGARSINLAMVKLAPELLKRFHDLEIIHQVGKGNAKVYGYYTHNRLHVLEFLSDLYRYTGAADLVVTRAGANTLAELGVQGKACIIVPNPQLTGGHQTKNAEYLLQHDAAIVVREGDLTKDPKVLADQIEELLADSGQRQKLATKLQEITIPDATERLALLLLDSIK